MSRLDSIDSVLLGDYDITPEKLAVMKLGPSDRDYDLFSEPDSPSSRKYSFNNRSESKSLARSTRQVSSTRHTSNYLSSHRSKMSLELTAQAESKFFSLMEIMSSASQEASSLKEYWSRLIADRQSSDREKEELLIQVSEVTEELERRESEHHSYHHELVEKKMQRDKLLVELSAALNIIKAQKKKESDRDYELEDSHKQYADLKSSFSRLQIDYNSFKSESERKHSKTTITETECQRAKDDAEKHLHDYRVIQREFTEVKEKLSFTSSRLESSQKEISSLKERIRLVEHERSNGLSERDRLQEELRIVKARSDEYYREYTQVTERVEHLQLEMKKTKESLRFAQSESEEYSSTVERLRHETKESKERLSEAETRYTDILVKFERSKRDCGERDGRISSFEFELTELRQKLEQKSEEYRLIVLERDQFKYDLESQRTGEQDKGVRVTTLEETIEKSESALTEVRSELTRTTERIHEIERERDDVRHRHGHLNTELVELKQKIVMLRTEIKNMTHARDHALKDVSKYKSKYEEVTQTMTEWHSSTEEFEVEIENLRFMLREAREQKERAVTARHAADRERDEFVAKYEDKCRQLERFEDGKFGHMHSHGRSGGRSSSTRFFKRSSTATNNEVNNHDDSMLSSA